MPLLIVLMSTIDIVNAFDRIAWGISLSCQLLRFVALVVFKA